MATITTQPSPTTGTSSCSCTSTQLTNCAILCATDTDPVSTYCFSTTCVVETVCAGTATTSTALMDHVCPLEPQADIRSAAGYSYEGLTRPTLHARPTFTSTVTTSTPTPTSDTSTTETTTVPISTETTSTTEDPTSTTKTSTETAAPAPTLGGKCDTLEVCPRCEEGYYRCCLGGCHGHLVPASNTCGCVKDGQGVNAVCGSK
ncbi:hypothetical protein BJX99DRAFT_256072 [Aspergillus californicus]